jgi:ATP-dependent DNA ligase
MYSKSGQDLGRYFPEIVAAALALREKKFMLDGEIVVPVEGRFRSTISCNASIPLRAV